jgi:hypothetical protein
VLRSRIRVTNTAVEFRGRVTLGQEPKTRRSRRTVPVGRSFMRQVEDHLTRYVNPPNALVFTAPRGHQGDTEPERYSAPSLVF